MNVIDRNMAQTNVLVVEDESIVSKDIQHSLKKLGYNVVGAANNGEAAVALLMAYRSVTFTLTFWAMKIQ